MRIFLLLIFSFSCCRLPAQKPLTFKINSTGEKQTYISLNLLSAAEPQVPLGLSAGARLTERTEIFTEASYITRSPIWDLKEPHRLSGARFLLQYRYHFLQRWKPLLGIRSARRSRYEPFAGIEGRWKPVSFQYTSDLVHISNPDTLRSFPVRGRANTFGLALIMGQTFQLSSNGNWQLELTAGVGGKERKVRLKNVPQGYQSITALNREWLYIPPIEASVSSVTFPLALRLRYRIN